MRRLSFVAVLLVLGCATREDARRPLLAEGRVGSQEPVAPAPPAEGSREGQVPPRPALTDAEREQVRLALADVRPGKLLRVTLVPGSTLQAPFQGLSDDALYLGSQPPGDTIPFERVAEVAVRRRATLLGTLFGTLLGAAVGFGVGSAYGAADPEWRGLHQLVGFGLGSGVGLLVGTGVGAAITTWRPVPVRRQGAQPPGGHANAVRDEGSTPAPE